MCIIKIKLIQNISLTSKERIGQKHLIQLPTHVMIKKTQRVMYIFEKETISAWLSRGSNLEPLTF
jgi:hypothetical protein